MGKAKGKLKANKQTIIGEFRIKQNTSWSSKPQVPKKRELFLGQTQLLPPKLS